MTKDLIERKIVDYSAQRVARRAEPGKIDAETRASLRAFRPVLEANLSKVLGDFDAYVASWPECRALIENEQGMTCLRRTQGQHWLSLFAGDLNDSYFNETSRIGRAHERVGLEPRWYMGAYCHVLKRIVELAIETYQGEPARLAAIVQAINRVVELDMELAVAVYNDSAKAREANTRNVEACSGTESAQPGFEPLRALDEDGRS